MPDLYLSLSCRNVTAKVARRIMRLCGHGQRRFPKRGYAFVINKKVADDLEIREIINYGPGDYVLFTHEPYNFHVQRTVDTFTPWLKGQ